MLAEARRLSAEYSPNKYRAASVALVTSGYPLGAMMTSVVAGIIMPEYGWRGMFWFGGAFTLVMSIVAWLLIPESLKYLFERRPDDALERINKILVKMKKDMLSAMPEVRTTTESPAKWKISLLTTFEATPDGHIDVMGCNSFSVSAPCTF